MTFKLYYLGLILILSQIILSEGQRISTGSSYNKVFGKGGGGGGGRSSSNRRAGGPYETIIQRRKIFGDADEGTCSNETPYSKLDENWFLSVLNGPGFYFVAASKYAITYFARSFIGKNIRFEKLSLDKLCPRNHKINNNTGMLVGYNLETLFQLNKIVKGKCEFWNLHEQDSVGASFDGATSTIIWTDNSKHVLSQMCFDGKKGWILASTKPELNPKSMEAAWTTLKQKGFDERNAVVVPFNWCYTKG